MCSEKYFSKSRRADPAMRDLRQLQPTLLLVQAIFGSAAKQPITTPASAPTFPEHKAHREAKSEICSRRGVIRRFISAAVEPNTSRVVIGHQGRGEQFAEDRGGVKNKRDADLKIFLCLASTGRYLMGVRLSRRVPRKLAFRSAKIERY